MPYQRKTTDEYVIQQYFGQWEDVTHCEDRQSARADLKDYRTNQPQYPARIIKRRVKKETAQQ